MAHLIRLWGGSIADEDTGPIVSDLVGSPFCGKLLGAWALLAGDPAAGIARWFTEGAPSGLATDFAELEGLLPESQLELDTDDFNNLHTDLDLF